MVFPLASQSSRIKERLAIALAVMHDPELLILDEPINGLDPIGIAEVRSFIRELCDARGKTILISSHILSEISLLADDIGIIDHGALLEEESLAELEQKSSKHIRFTLSDTAQAARILERNFHETHFSIQDDHNLRLHNMELPVGKIVTAFVENRFEASITRSGIKSKYALSWNRLDITPFTASTSVFTSARKKA